MSDTPRHVDHDAHKRRALALTVIGGALAGVVAVLVVLGVLLTSGDPSGSASSVAAGNRSPVLATPSPVAPAAVAGLARMPVHPSPSRTPSPTHSRTPTKPSTPKATHGGATTGNSSFAAQVVTLVNKQRTQNGCAELSVDSRLTSAAQGHSADMASRNYFEHNTPEGKDPGDRITAAGYKWRAYGENIAEGQADPASVMDAWMNSPGHRANILNCSFRNIGVGVAFNAKRTPYWTQDFGALM